MLDAVSADALAPWERAGKTRAEMASEGGISERTLRRRLALARQIEAGVSDVNESRGAEEMPWVELASGPRPGLHYRLDADDASVLPSGPFRIGDHTGRRLRVANAGDGRPVEKAKESKHKFKPKARKKRAG